ncbi:sensor histidine kinase [Actinomadura roseirufa]|uniref:sensor histidine kinase n=1 Tax=Actinomadura roseirufa TaxID=2094049 RepID=UPI0010411366|nr:histidine kinase [Actinomadura roseirufa]
MRRPAGRGPLRWCGEIVRGMYRSALLAGLTAVIPAVAVATGIGGSKLAFSWSAGRHAPWIARALAASGDTLVVVLWIAVAVYVVFMLAGRPLTQAARALARRWLALPLRVSYRPVPPVTQMATGFWWNGSEYHESEREARRRATMIARFHDPQLLRDALWIVVSAVTVLPVTALPVLVSAGGAYLITRPGSTAEGIAMIAGALLTAPFAWRIVEPLAPRLLGSAPRSRLGRRLDEVETSRANLTQAQAAELERIERGLHDGPQARLVALGMSMIAAERFVDTDPAAAKTLLAEARVASAAALAELRSLVRGINPPVLTERGLVDAVRLLALDAPVEVTVVSAVPARPERPVEAAVYFAVAELLANVAKHAQANHVKVELSYASETLTASVTDDGVGGAVKSSGSGLSGIERRMAAFSGRVEIDSPAGGPTRVTVAVPCALS